MSAEAAFFAFYEGLPRQGPGDRASQEAALRLLGNGESQRMYDAGCGSGADIEGLLAWAPGGTVFAVDTHAPFIETIRLRYVDDARVTAETCDMAAVDGPFDLIWCAGALYFMGLEAGLAAFREKLSPGGAVVFSYPAFFTETPSDVARAFWQGEDVSVPGTSELTETVRQAGLSLLDARPLGDAAWEAYYRPMETHIADLRPNADEAMSQVLDAAEAEISGWRVAKRETGYLQVVATRS